MNQHSQGQIIKVKSKTVVSAPTSSGTYTAVMSGGGGLRTRSNSPTQEQIENAIYSHIQAKRTLGVKTISVGEIANALSLPDSVVMSAMKRLHDKGVKPL